MLPLGSVAAKLVCGSLACFTLTVHSVSHQWLNTSPLFLLDTLLPAMFC